MSFNDTSLPGEPPGTVYLQDLSSAGSSKEIILHPAPSSDPNDPLVRIAIVSDTLDETDEIKNWSRRRKYVNFAFVSFYTTLVYALLNVQTVTWGDLNTQLGFSYDILNDSYAAGTAALMVGGLTLIPFALKFGRRFVYCFSLLVQTGMAVWYSRTHTIGDLMGSNVISCLFGALSEILVQLTVADVFFVHERGLMNSIYFWIAQLGSSLSTIPGGYITASSLGWRWVWYIMTILLGVVTVLFFFFYEETQYQRGQAALVEGEVIGPDLAALHDPSKIKTARQQSLHDARTMPQKKEQEEDTSSPPLETTAPLVQTNLNRYVDHSIPEKSYREKMKLWISAPGSFWYYSRHTYQCFLVMWHIPSVFYFACLNGASNTAQIICITVYSNYLLDAPYNWSEADVGLMGISAFVGTALCAPLLGQVSDRMIVWMARRNGGIYEPEMRLWLILYSAPIFVLGQLLFGIGLAHNLPWPAIAVGYAIVNFSVTPPGSLSLTYLTDAYTEIIADCLVALDFVKFGFATIFIFAQAPWIQLDGLQNFFIIITVVYLVIYLGNYLLIRYGKTLRKRCAPKYMQLADRQVMNII